MSDPEITERIVGVCKGANLDLLIRALRLAKEATNGWACYAKRKVEHDNIAHLHHEIAELERDATTTRGRPDLDPTVRTQ
jgi:hypothetical protein